LGMLCMVPSTGSAQVKVYWTTSGMFGPFNIQGLIPSIPKEKARDITIPISMWVIDHPKGLVVVDTGNNAAVSDGGCKSHWEAGVFVMAAFDGPARDFNYLELEGDYDLFGDGTVTVLSTPGHTLGHQSVKVKLGGGQTLVLSQDAIWMKENLDGYPAGLNYSVKDYNNSVNRLKMIRDLENAEIFFAHDQDQFAAKGGKWYR